MDGERSLEAYSSRLQFPAVLQYGPELVQMIGYFRVFWSERFLF
jgi:hypothetical protein